MGLRTAVVERDPTGCGGTCLLRGCIPTKALLHTADLYEDLKNGKEFGIVAEKIGIDFPAVMSRKARIVTRLSKGIETYLFKKNKITLFNGQGRLEGKGTVGVTGAKEERRGANAVPSGEILQIPGMPKTLIVTGGGAVGIEFASVFARFGSTVPVIEMLPRVLPLEDEEISAEAGKVLGKQMTIHTGARTQAAIKTPAGVEVAFTTAAGETKTLTADLLLLAVGRGPVTDGLGLETTRIPLDRGFIRVNPLQETAEPGVLPNVYVASHEVSTHPP